MTTSYLYNLQVYTGKLLGNASKKNLGKRVVFDLMELLFETGKDVTMDNLFTSASTAEFLQQNNIIMTGALRAKKLDIPTMMKAVKDTVFCHQNLSL